MPRCQPRHSERMLKRLQEIEHHLPDLLNDPEGWHSKLIDYHPPKVERLWRDFDGNRILLHRIHPCLSGGALFHPHPWPSAVVVLDGGYEMGLGQGPDEPKHPAATLLLAPGSRYEMLDPLGWHWVRPGSGPSLSLMVTGPVWQGLPAPQTEGYHFPPLAPDVITGMLNDFRYHYPEVHT